MENTALRQKNITKKKIEKQSNDIKTTVNKNTNKINFSKEANPHKKKRLRKTCFKGENEIEYIVINFLSNQEPQK